jgi:hypothetical protein
MAGIPPALKTDTEDVAWALQTADALWKRNERVDAVVWLRRAAQAAADVDDDDRALALARNAADLSEWIAQHLSVRPTRRAPPADELPSRGVDERPSAGAVVDELLSRTDSRGSLESIDPDETEKDDADEEADDANQADHGEDEPDEVTLPEIAVVAAVESPRVSLSHALRKLAATAAVPEGAHQAPPPRGRALPPPVPPPPRGAGDVPTAAELHAGMLDPWAEGEGRTNPRNLHPESSRGSVASSGFDTGEVITSAGVSSRRDPSESLTSNDAGSLDLAAVEALSDMPDDARQAFARTAKVQELGGGEEVCGFALALVLDGSVDVAAALVGVAARTLGSGEMLRGRGSIELVAPVRLIASSDGARLATWSERQVADAFRACPWVEEELRAGADRTHALVGVTMGRLGARLDPTMRTDITNRLRLRVLMPHEIVTHAGDPVPGFFVVGAGQLEFLGKHGAPNGQALRAGDFLFPSEVLRAASAPTSVRAGDGGALALVADRGVSQELLVTCPPLLEVFAEG